MWMLLRKQKSTALLCASIICLLLVLHWASQCSNFFDLVSHLLSPDSPSDESNSSLSAEGAIQSSSDELDKVSTRKLSSGSKPEPELSTEPNALPLSLQCNLGRLGNQMCSFATLYGISALNHRRFVALSCNVNKLKDIFVGPSKAPTKLGALYLRWNSWSLLSYMRPEDAAIPPNFNFLDGYLYPCSYTFFDHVANEIRRQFQFKDHFTQYAQDALRLANIQKLENVTYVGLHVRRGDYQKHWLEAFDGVPVNMEYFEQSLGYFRQKYHNVIVIAVSDDRLWCTRELSKRFGVYVPPEAPSPAHDLAILANCNHTILTYGTFGFWGAYLAGGEVLYFDKFLRPNTSFTREKFIFDKMYPPRWKGIVTVNASIWLQGTDSTAKSHGNATKKT